MSRVSEAQTGQKEADDLVGVNFLTHILNMWTIITIDRDYYFCSLLGEYTLKD